MVHRLNIEFSANGKYLVSSFSIEGAGEDSEVTDEKRAFESLQEVFEFADKFFPSDQHGQVDD